MFLIYSSNCVFNPVLFGASMHGWLLSQDKSEVMIICVKRADCCDMGNKGNIEEQNLRFLLYCPKQLMLCKNYMMIDQVCFVCLLFLVRGWGYRSRLLTTVHRNYDLDPQYEHPLKFLQLSSRLLLTRFRG